MSAGEPSFESVARDRQTPGLACMRFHCFFSQVCVLCARACVCACVRVRARARVFDGGPEQGGWLGEKPEGKRKETIKTGHYE